VLLENQLVFEGPVDGDRTYYSDPELNAMLAQADKAVVYARSSNAGGTTPTFTVDLEHSLDNRYFVSYSTLITQEDIGANSVFHAFGSDTGANPAGGYVRLAITLSGTSPTGDLSIWMTGRSA